MANPSFGEEAPNLKILCGFSCSGSDPDPVEKAKALWQALKNKVKGKDGKDGKAEDDDRSQEQKEADVAKATNEATQLLKHQGATEDGVRKQLPPIKAKYKLATLELVVDSKDSTKERVHIHAKINPERDGEEVELPEGMAEFVADFSSAASRKGHADKEYDEMKRQLQEAQQVLNGMTILEWCANRTGFIQTKKDAKARGVKNPEGRDPEGTRLQQKARQQAEIVETNRLLKENPSLSAEEAKAQARETLKDKMATHKLDQVFGGRKHELSAELGEGREDVAIGAAWQSKARKVDELIKDIPEEVQRRSPMRVKITLDGQPVGVPSGPQPLGLVGFTTGE